MNITQYQQTHKRVQNNQISINKTLHFEGEAPPNKMEFSSKEFKVGKCEGQKEVDGETMPLVLQPPESDKANFDSLLLALKNNKDWLDQMIIKHSAVLLRGYDVSKPQEFNEIVEAFGWEDIRYVGPAPRTHIYKRIWTANEGPLSEFIYYHHEMVLVTTKLLKFLALISKYKHVELMNE